MDLHTGNHGIVRALIQRVVRAHVAVDGEVVGAIGPGLCVLVGVTHSDDESVARKLAEKTWHLRIFEDDAGLMNKALADQPAPAALCISQFTLYADTSRGRRPSWTDAAAGPAAEPVFNEFVRRLRSLGSAVATGRFGAKMLVELVNDGPVTVMIEG
jgi:D-tyrosyl-tRNA(Tyr) deacylase